MLRHFTSKPQTWTLGWPKLLWFIIWGPPTLNCYANSCCGCLDITINKWEILTVCSPTWKAKALPVSLWLSIWEPWISALIFMGNHPIGFSLLKLKLRTTSRESLVSGICPPCTTMACKKIAWQMISWYWGVLVWTNQNSFCPIVLRGTTCWLQLEDYYDLSYQDD